MFAIVHGPRYPVRIIVVTTRTEAGHVFETLQNGDSFSEVAIQQSIDSSSVTGGRVSAISCADPSWPAPIRESISTLGVGEISPPIFIGDRWAIINVTDEPSTPSVQFRDVENKMRELATRTQERFLMENLAQRLIKNSTMKIFDKDLQKISSPNAHSSQ
jgi:parvulin-like peptidyl-prolyl isomerase